MRPLVAIDARLIGREATGDGTYWTALVGGLAEVAPEAPLLLLSDRPAPPGLALPSGWRWQVAPARSGRWWSLVAFPLAARRAGARAVHTQYNLSPLVGRGGVTTVHDVSFFVEPSWFGARDRALLRRFVPASVRRSARVIAVSETARAEIERFIPAARGKCEVARLASPPWIEPIDRDRARARAAALAGDDRPFVLTLGDDWPRKNQRLAVEAVRGLAGEKVALFLAGKNIRPPADPRVRALGYVSRPDLCALYSAAEALVFPSLHEGFGLPVLEAFVCGCPVICGRGGALPEVAGGAAELVSSYEPRAWTLALEALLSSNLDAVRERGRRRAAEFSWAETARRTRAIYDAVVDS